MQLYAVLIVIIILNAFRVLGREKDKNTLKFMGYLLGSSILVGVLYITSYEILTHIKF